MDRRHLLVSICGGVFVLVAGCSEASDGRYSPSATDTESRPTPPPGDVQRRVTLAGQDSAPEQAALEITAEVTQPWITAERSALVRISTVNRGSERAFSVGDHKCAIFNREKNGSDEPAGLWLHQWPGRTPTRVEGEWVADRPADETRVYAAYGCLPRTYEPGEAVVTTYQVWHDYREDGYLEPGEYRWEQAVEVWNDPEADGGSAPSEEFNWGFSLRVSES